MPSSPNPDAYEICEKHMKNFVAPKGWKVIRIQTQLDNSVSEQDLQEIAQRIIVAASRPVAMPEFTPPEITSNPVIEFRN